MATTPATRPFPLITEIDEPPRGWWLELAMHGNQFVRLMRHMDGWSVDGPEYLLIGSWDRVIDYANRRQARPSAMGYDRPDVASLLAP